VQQIVSIMKMQYRFARTGEGWDEYMAALDNLAARIGPPPETFPRTKNHPQWNAIRLLYFHDPGPTLRQLRVPTLAIFGELDNNILAAKNKAAWEAALSAAGNPDYTLRVLPRANHYQMEARVGSNAEAPALMRFVPEYFTTVHEWLARRINGYR
jgi:pimeloyl-ACP methyl ester carboxylesterase